MKLLTELKAKCADVPTEREIGAVPSLHHEGAPGVFRRLILGHNGLTIRNATGEAVVFVPLSELLALAEKHEPALCGEKKKIN